MALLGSCNRTIHTHKRPENKAFRLRKAVLASPASFGDRFRLSRLSYSYTQHEIACKFGVSLSAVKFWEQNRYQPNGALRAQVETFLNTAPVDNFLKTQRGTSVDSRVGNLQSARLTKDEHL